jgi:hypothetical protein
LHGFLLGFQVSQGFWQATCTAGTKARREPYKKTRHGVWLYIFLTTGDFLTTHNRRQPWICPPKNPLRKLQSQPACISGGWRFCDVAKTIGGVVSKAADAWMNEWFTFGRILAMSFAINVSCIGGKKMVPNCLIPRKWKFISTNTWHQV